jgi:DNA-binding NarL/FixJ family response regulator
MRLLLADDHALFRQSLRALLESRGIEVIGEAVDGCQAVELAKSLQPDIVLMDLGMPKLGGLEATRQLAAELPSARVIVLTASTEDDDLFEALKAGAQGYLLKDLDADAFVKLLEGALSGQPALTPALSAKILHSFSRPSPSREPADQDALTERELEVLHLLVEGITSNRQLATRLGVAENTVKFHVRNILDKLHLHNRAQAVSVALRRKMVEPSK